MEMKIIQRTNGKERQHTRRAVVLKGISPANGLVRVVNLLLG